jgi:hypothetical protein
VTGDDRFSLSASPGRRAYLKAVPSCPLCTLSAGGSSLTTFRVELHFRSVQTSATTSSAYTGTAPVAVHSRCSLRYPDLRRVPAVQGACRAQQHALGQRAEGIGLQFDFREAIGAFRQMRDGCIASRRIGECDDCRCVQNAPAHASRPLRRGRSPGAGCRWRPRKSGRHGRRDRSARPGSR